MKILSGIILFCALLVPQSTVAQTVKGDSAVLRQIAEFRLEENWEVVLCVSVTKLSDTSFVADSIPARVSDPPCPEHTNGLFAVAPPDIPKESADLISSYLLRDWPQFVVVCAITDAKEVANYLVPLLLCKLR